MDVKDWRVSDPLSEVTRKERRLLLAVSVLAFFMAKTGAIPSKISTLGIEFQSSDQRFFLYVLAASVLYLTTVFIAYAMSDFIAWRKAILRYDIKDREELFDELRQQPSNAYEADIEKFKEDIYRKNRSIFRMTRPVSVLRAFIEFVLPVFVGLTVSFAVYRSALSLG
ncbi:hypothetical protein K8U54_03675 [Pseudomonas fulva]|uniref:hypothetical protein n=1 Tax=Pseudomonas fulva TaxID=47880 RepID=UPI00201E4067|nr:hypothetical protein [Pseudomonas fulva]UQY35603.1 hypothetical protein K8U54_03675 [Pseudomonas fulva]